MVSMLICLPVEINLKSAGPSILMGGKEVDYGSSGVFVFLDFYRELRFCLHLFMVFLLLLLQ
jgi:hypothetical protein